MPSGKAVQLINIEKEKERKVDGAINARKAEENRGNTYLAVFKSMF